jgi:hypothetical protein
VVAEHHAWVEAHDDQQAAERSPLERFAQTHGLTANPGIGRSGDWPSYGPAPEVIADGMYVVLHVDYTITMPPVFGELMYRRGGRVGIELDHAHHPLVWVHEVWWPWQGRKEEVVTAGRVRLLDLLLSEAGPLRTQVMIRQPASWTDQSELDLSLAAIWNEPMVAIPQVRAMVTAVGANARLHVMEAIDAHDPAGLFRPCSPWPSENLVDVVVERKGDAPKAVIDQLAATVLKHHRDFPGTHKAAAALVEKLPATVAWALPPAVASACARELEYAGATVRLVDHAYPERLVTAPPD